ncbi:hypothetical protein NMY22_g15905 [Coprinellus aureogranulatus]|nr:hypothetical protein NMY22_g15905 [Coprinellus aureogranulatus]
MLRSARGDHRQILIRSGPDEKGAACSSVGYLGAAYWHGSIPTFLKGAGSRVPWQLILTPNFQDMQNPSSNTPLASSAASGSISPQNNSRILASTRHGHLMVDMRRFSVPGPAVNGSTTAPSSPATRDNEARNEITNSPGQLFLRSTQAQGGRFSAVRRGEVSLLSLPNELLSELGSHFLGDEDSRHLTSFMLACRRTSGIAEYLRYTSVTVLGERGYRLLAMLVSGSEVSMRYCALVKRLWFRGKDDERVRLTSHLLSVILPRLVNLRTLTIDARMTDTKQLLEKLGTTGIVREQRHPALSMSKAWLDRADFSILAMPNVRFLRVAGAVEVWKLGSFRALTELDLDFIMDIDTFANFLFCAEGSVLGGTLHTLSLRFSRMVALVMAFPMLSDAFHSLEHLYVEHGAFKLEEIVDRHAVGAAKQNGDTAFRRKPPTAVQTKETEHHLIGIARNHGRLCCIGIRGHVWESGYGGVFVLDTARDESFWKQFFGNQFLPRLAFLFNRIIYVLVVQSWDMLAEHNWIYIALHLLLGSADL